MRSGGVGGREFTLICKEMQKYMYLNIQYMYLRQSAEDKKQTGR